MINNIEIVEIINNQPMTNSLKIAEVFGKEHKNILSGIKSLKCSQEFNELNFKLVNYTDSKGEQRPMYNITKDGFVFLVMGYTGEKACRFKELYIKTFNEMEQVIKQPQPKTNLINLDLSNSIIKLLKDKDCLLTWNDMIEISHKRDVKEVCRFLSVKCISQKGDINQLISTLENQQEFLKLETQNLIGNEKLLTATEIGAMLGISALKVGKIANVLNLKCEKYGQWFKDKASHSIKEVQTFKYNGNVVDKIKHYLANGQNIA